MSEFLACYTWSWAGGTKVGKGDGAGESGGYDSRWEDGRALLVLLLSCVGGGVWRRGPVVPLSIGEDVVDACPSTLAELNFNAKRLMPDMCDLLFYADIAIIRVND